MTREDGACPHHSMVPNSHLGSLLKGITMPWNRDIFTAISLEMSGSHRSSVRRRRLWGDTAVMRAAHPGGPALPWELREAPWGGCPCGGWPEPGRGDPPRQAPAGWGEGGPVPYRNVLLQPPLGKDPIEPWPQRPLGQDGEHHALQHQRVHALRTQAVSPHDPRSPRGPHRRHRAAARPQPGGRCWQSPKPRSCLGATGWGRATGRGVPAPALTCRMAP